MTHRFFDIYLFIFLQIINPLNLSVIIIKKIFLIIIINFCFNFKLKITKHFLLYFSYLFKQ